MGVCIHTYIYAYYMQSYLSGLSGTINCGAIPETSSKVLATLLLKSILNKNGQSSACAMIHV